MPASKPTTWQPPRGYPRFLMDQRLVIRAGATLHGRTKDISEGGLGATVAGELNRNEPLELEFCLPGSSKPLKLKAEIRYHQGFQYGFRFLHILESQRKQIREAARKLEAAP